MLIEARAYDESSSPAEVAVIRDRVFLYRPGIVYWNEVPVMSVWQVQQFGIRLGELTADLDEFSLLIDLEDSKPPDARIRVALREVYARAAETKMGRAAAFTGSNFIINVAAKFVLGGSGLKSFSVHSARADAEAMLGLSA